MVHSSVANGGNAVEIPSVAANRVNT